MSTSTYTLWTSEHVCLSSARTIQAIKQANKQAHKVKIHRHRRPMPALLLYLRMPSTSQDISAHFECARGYMLFILCFALLQLAPGPETNWAQIFPLAELCTIFEVMHIRLLDHMSHIWMKVIISWWFMHIHDVFWLFNSKTMIFICRVLSTGSCQLFWAPYLWPFPKVLRLKSSILGDCIRPLVMKRLARRKCSPGEPELGQ